MLPPHLAQTQTFLGTTDPLLLHLLLLLWSAGLTIIPSSATTTSTLAEPSATNDVAAHSVRLNSSLSAVTLPDGNRHVYFQEAAGGLRRALYSSRTKQWQQAAGGFSVLGAKNDTPLAAAVFRTAADNVVGQKASRERAIIGAKISYFSLSISFTYHPRT